MVLAMWEYAHMMAIGVQNAMVPRLRLYLRYWRNEVDFSSARITFDRLYCAGWVLYQFHNHLVSGRFAGCHHMLTFSMLQVISVAIAYKTVFFNIGIFDVKKDSSALSNVFKKLKHVSAIIGCWDYHWSTHLLLLHVWPSVDISTCNKSTC